MNKKRGILDLILLSILFCTTIFAQHFNIELEDTGESTLFIFNSDVTSLEIGDEVGLFDGDLLVGTGTWGISNSAGTGVWNADQESAIDRRN